MKRPIVASAVNGGEVAIPSLPVVVLACALPLAKLADALDAPDDPPEATPPPAPSV